MKNLKIFAVTIGLVIIGCLTTFFLVKQTSNNKNLKIGYINSGELFESFDYTIEVKNDWKIEENHMKSSLDSLRMMLNQLDNLLQEGNMNKELHSKQYNRIYSEYVSREQHLTEYSQNKIRQLDEQIIERLNQYISDYAKANNYDLIVGSGSGGLLHAIDDLEITNELIQFANSKYAGS